MGVVFAALSPEGGRCALKVLSPSQLLSESDRSLWNARFQREIAALSRVEHPNVVRIFQVGQDHGYCYFAMELLDGESLRERIERCGLLPPAEVIAFGGQLLAALGAVHAAGIVHRDVKPENVLVTADGSLRLTDFGIARLDVDSTLTQTGGILGSPAYMAPEQLLGDAVDRRTDIYAVAATLYQAASGRLPFVGEGLVQFAQQVLAGDPRPMPAEVPRGLAEVILHGLRRSPAARYASTEEFSLALRRCTDGGGLAPTTPRPTPDGAVCTTCGRTVPADHTLCRIHRPVELLGVRLVWVEAAAVAAVFLFLMLCLSPVGYALFR